MPGEKQEITFIVIAGTIIIGTLSGFIIFFVAYYQNRRKQHKLEKQALQSQYQQTLLQAQLEIQEQTLKNISQEIHDNIGQVLSLVKLNINTMSADKPADLREKIADSKTLIVKAIQDLRDLSRSLDTDQISHIGFFRAVETELDLLRKTGLQVRMEATGKPYRIDPQKELILFRIVQEVLNNIIKHANADSIDTMLLFEEHQLRLTVSDNGKGFDGSALHRHENSTFGLGIRNMHHRARLIGADCSIHSTPGNGTTVTINLPVTPKPLNDAKI